MTKDLVESSSDLAKEILTSRNIVSEHDQLTSEIIEAKISLLISLLKKMLTYCILVYKKKNGYGK